MSHLEPTVYIQNTCQHCHRQVDWMEQKGYAFVEKEVSDPEHREEFFAHGGAGTPSTVFIASDGSVTLVQGFQRQKLENLLEQNN